MCEWKTEYIFCLCVITKIWRLLLKVAGDSYINQDLTLPSCKFLNFFIEKIELINFRNMHFSIFHLYLLHVTKFPFNILTFFSVVSRELLELVYRFGHSKKKSKKWSSTLWGHSKSMEGGRGSLKRETKRTGVGGWSLSVRSLCEKNFLIFRTTNRAFFDKLLGSC